MLFKRSPMPLSKLDGKPASEVAAHSRLQPEAQKLLQPDQTPSQYLHSLEQQQMPMDSMNFLAGGMSEQDSVYWATQSSQQVAGKLNAPDQAALAAAEEWVKDPTPDNQALAAKAAEESGLEGPGGWAAQAAAWSQNPTSSTPPVNATSASGVPGGGPVGLVAAAVVGSVLLAAGLVKGKAMSEAPRPTTDPLPPAVKTPSSPDQPGFPQTQEASPEVTMPPVDNNKLAKTLKPFLELGKKIANGQSPLA